MSMCVAYCNASAFGIGPIAGWERHGFGRRSAAVRPRGWPVSGDDPLGDIDSALVARALAGEDVAFELLVVKYQRRVAATVRRFVRDDRITEELTQDVFMRVYVALSSFDPAGSFQAWLFTIARNLAKSYLRSPQNRMDDQPREATLEEAVGSRSRVAPSPEEEAMAHQLFGRIDAAVEALPGIQRTALLMREVEGLDYGISEKLAMPVNTVKSHIYRAREAVASGLRELLGPTRERRW